MTFSYLCVAQVECFACLQLDCYKFTYFSPLFSSFQFYAEDVTVAICPGIGNSSETVYIRSFVHLAQSVGYRCAVLNHIGALPSVEVTSSRIFSYGKWFISFSIHCFIYNLLLNTIGFLLVTIQVFCHKNNVSSFWYTLKINVAFWKNVCNVH